MGVLYLGVFAWIVGTLIGAVLGALLGGGDD